jgi:hypothetical protein
VISPFLVAPVILAVGAVVAWVLSKSAHRMRAARTLRIGAAVLGILSVPAATLDYIGLGLSADFDRAFVEEDFGHEELARRLAAIDRWTVLIVVSGMAGGISAVCALLDLRRKV